jgi:hypothetical protein
VSDFIDDNNSERSIFENARPFKDIWSAVGEVAQSYLPTRKSVVENIPHASAKALCRADEALDKAYA